MRVYYVFKINNFFTYMYKNRPYKLYKILEEMYHYKDYDMVLSYKYYEQIATNFNKANLNDKLYHSLIEDKYYSKKGNIHIYADNYEYTRLGVTNTNLKIKTNINYPTFFKVLNSYNYNIFVCDFYNKDYFWLDKIISKQKIPY